MVSKKLYNLFLSLVGTIGRSLASYYRQESFLGFLKEEKIYLHGQFIILHRAVTKLVYYAINKYLSSVPNIIDSEMFVCLVVGLSSKEELIDMIVI